MPKTQPQTSENTPPKHQVSAKHADSLSVTRFELGPFETNCYVVRFAGSTDCWIVDASYEPEEMIAYVQREGLRRPRWCSRTRTATTSRVHLTW